MIKRITLLLITSVLFLSSCKDENYVGETADFGTAKYYKPFLFVKSDTVVLSKTLNYDFNDYAVEQKSFAKIKWVDENKKPIQNKNIRFFVNGVQSDSNEFEISSKVNKGQLELGIQMLPDFPKGYTSGFLSISNHQLDVVNNLDLGSASEDRIFKWEATHKVVMNPLKKGLMWVGILILALLSVWFLVLRNMLHPKFKRGKIQILSPYFGGVSFNQNTKLIVFTSTIKKQSAFNRIFTGKIIYEVNPIYSNDIILRPGRANKIKIKLPVGVTIKPAVANLDKFSEYTIMLNKNIIKIQYS
ncbi:hypothetical protein Q73A0000_05175 [Kaistella flava (ex Peng et al. 2021)]|uniref:Uncharacterized protein n=1 Tax=Kaistella flava (ex Peng et al. 2021) TaxID=2038776 RepID=A0A7M2Y8S4_9FLAO|nr:hypothetical protein [Kaistella flava (ex Peng et al. 2021)]QOW09802.1 hypothetical protein Q73A0000_05175 [Kaistella flava (ex Peng et al. 2021)]